MKALIVFLSVILFLGITLLTLSVWQSKRADAQTKLLVTVGYAGVVYFIITTISNTQ
jgi:cytochrome oxidase assembly protein ShyY1